MKCLVLFLGLIIFCGACSRKANYVASEFHWESISPEADSVVVALERGFMASASGDSLDALIRMLEQSAASSAVKPQILCRAYFWKARVANREHRPIGNWLDIALAICDSIAFPYDYIRIKYLRSVLKEQDNRALYYSNLKRYAGFYQKTHDDFMLASTLLDLGHLLREAGYIDQAFANYFKADSIYVNLNLIPYHLKTSLNNANILFEAGYEDKSHEILLSLLDSEEARRDSDFYANLRLTAFNVTHDSAYLSAGFNDIIRRQGVERIKTMYMIGMGRMYLDSGMINKAQPIVESLIGMLHDFSSKIMREQICRLAYETYDSLGIMDSVYKYQEMTIKELDGQFRENNMAKIASIEGKTKIQEVEHNLQMQKRRDRLMLVVIILSLTSLSMAVIILLMRKSHRHKISLMETRLSLESKQRRVLSSSLAMTEKDNVLEAILKQMEGIADNGQTETTDIIRRLQNDIKLHLNGKQDWEDFHRVFEEVHPSFATVLKQRWPDVSEGDIRLATYIRIGLTSKQIARMLLLQPDSVKKNRQRLRRRMNLSADESLENVLREL